MSNIVSAAGNEASIDPKNTLGYVKWIVVSLIAIMSLTSVGTGIYMFGHDADKGKRFFIGGILGALFAALVGYFWGKMFGTEVVVDIKTSF